MCWHKQLKSATCFSKESRLASNMEEQFQQKRLNYNTRRRQQRASENEEKRKESFKIRNKKDRDNNGRRNENINSRDPCEFVEHMTPTRHKNDTSSMAIQPC